MHFCYVNASAAMLRRGKYKNVKRVDGDILFL